MHTIYLVTCKENGMQYVGQTIQGVDARWYDHCKRSRNKKDKEYNLPLKKDIRKYGKENFTVEELAFTEDDATADYLEEYYIRLFNLVEDGYNYNYGRGQKGVTCPWMKTDEVRELRRQRTIGSKNPKARAVICVELNKRFDTVKEASEFAGVNESCIRDCCKGRQLTSGGYHWVYEDPTIR